MGEKKPETHPLYNYIIHTKSEPGIIDNALLTKCILEFGPTEEAGRLFDEEGARLDEAHTVRIEFHNIIRIDHLWMLKSLTKLSLAHNKIEKIENLERLTALKELDLSFNEIDKIENLEALVKLEVLTLFHNQIRKLENMETLQELLVFSIGENLIEDYKQMAYLRQFRKLRSVSFKGNPCSDDPTSYDFLRAALTRVTYLDYVIVKEEEREDGRSIFRGLLRKLDEKDQKAEAARLAVEAYDAQVVFYAVSFVEYLSGPELVETMFSQDPDGTCLLAYGGPVQESYEKYKEDYVETMDHLVEFAQNAYTERQNEIKLFRSLVDNALEESVKKSQAIIDKYESLKQPLVNKSTALGELLKLKNIHVDDVEFQLMEMTEKFNEYIFDMWKSLMTIEMYLFEQCEDSRVQFGVNMSEMVTKLLETSRTAFGEWRQHDGAWSMHVLDCVSHKIGIRTMPLDASSQLRMAVKDRDTLVNMVANSSDAHMRFIDAREDVLIKRASRWRNKTVSGTNHKEVNRNRDRIMEINTFVDNEREDWAELHAKILELPDQEALGLINDL